MRKHNVIVGILSNGQLRDSLVGCQTETCCYNGFPAPEDFNQALGYNFKPNGGKQLEIGFKVE